MYYFTSDICHQDGCTYVGASIVHHCERVVVVVIVILLCDVVVTIIIV